MFTKCSYSAGHRCTSFPFVVLCPPPACAGGGEPQSSGAALGAGGGVVYAAQAARNAVSPPSLRLQCEGRGRGLQARRLHLPASSRSNTRPHHALHSSPHSCPSLLHLSRSTFELRPFQPDKDTLERAANAPRFPKARCLVARASDGRGRDDGRLAAILRAWPALHCPATACSLLGAPRCPGCARPAPAPLLRPSAPRAAIADAALQPGHLPPPSTLARCATPAFPLAAGPAGVQLFLLIQRLP